MVLVNAEGVKSPGWAVSGGCRGGMEQYGTQNTLSGPFLTSVMGKEAGEREFWQLLRAPDTPLLQGIAEYTPKDGETIELRLASW
ncbi:transcobalamin-2 [Prionailurus iriomotensis]